MPWMMMYTIRNTRGTITATPAVTTMTVMNRSTATSRPRRSEVTTAKISRNVRYVQSRTPNADVPLVKR